MPELSILVLGLIGLGLGLGLGFLKFVPPVVSGLLSVFATVVIAWQFAGLIGLPSIELVDAVTGVAWLAVPALGFIAGERLMSTFTGGS